MERHDIRMFTSAWKRYYQESIRGCYMPQLGEWSAESGWIAGNQQLHVDGNFINPAPLILIVTGRVRDRELSVTINYTTATFSSWDAQFYNGRSYKYPVYVDGVVKSKTFTIAAFTDCETVMRICEEDNLIYKINSVTVTNNRYDERFFIYALASPTARIIYSQNWHQLYETMVREKRGLFAAPTVCPTCQGTGLRSSVTCPECGGWGFSGSNATGVLLDRLGKDVGIVRESSVETDESFRKKVWARRWWLIPTKDEIKRYFKHFCHVDDAEMDVIEIPDDHSPTFFVCVNPWEMGSGAIWQPGATFENYDGVVERACPAGVNGYFAWLGYSQEEFGDNPIQDSITSQGWMLDGDGYGSAFEVSQFLEANFGELLDSTSENMLDDFQQYENLDAIPTERPDLWSLVGGSFSCVSTIIQADPHDFEWHDVGTFVPEDDPREMWEIHNSLVAEMFTNFTAGDDISGAIWMITGTDGSANTFKAANYYSICGNFSKTNTGLAMDAKLTFPDSHDMSHAGWFDGDGVRMQFMAVSFGSSTAFQYSVTRADGTDMICVRFNPSNSHIEVLDNTTWTDTGFLISVGSGQDSIDVYYQSETTFIVVVNGMPVGSTTPTVFTNKDGASWASGNCASVHFYSPTADVATVYLYYVCTTWEQSSGDTKTGVFAVEEHTYDGATHRMLDINWTGVLDNNQEVRVQFPAPIATLSNHVVEFDWMYVGTDYQHEVRFYNANGDCVQEVDGYSGAFFLLDYFLNESTGMWQVCGFSPALDDVAASKYYRIRITFIDNTHFKMDVYDYAESTWHYGADLEYGDSTTAANLSYMTFTRQASAGRQYHVGDVTLSWLPLAEYVAGTSVGELLGSPTSAVDDFSTYGAVGTDLDSTSGPLGDWGVIYYDATGQSFKIAADGDGYCAKLADADGGGYCRIAIGFDTPMPVGAVFSIDTKTSNRENTTHWCCLNRADGGCFAHLVIMNSDGHVYYYDTSWHDTGFDVSNDTWYTIWYKIISETTYEMYIGSRGCAEPDWDSLPSLNAEYSLVGSSLTGFHSSSITWTTGDWYFANLTASWMEGEYSTGEVIGTYPVVSGTAFQNYRAKMDVMFDESAETYQVEVGITEDAKTDDADLRIHLAFKNSDKLAYYHNGTSLVSTGIYWNDPHEGSRVEKFSGHADHTNLDDDAQWAPYTGDESDESNCGAEYLAGEGHFYSLADNGGLDTVAKLYTFPVASGGTGIVNSYIDIRYEIGNNKAFDLAVGGSGIPAIYLRLVEDSGTGMRAEVMTVALVTKAIDIDFTMNPLKLKFEFDMDNQTFKVYQQVLGMWSLRTIEDAYDDFWGAIASMSIMLLQLTGAPSHVYIDNIANDWDTEVDSCDATFEIAVVAANKFHIRKDDGEWSGELSCKNAFTTGIKYLKLKTIGDGGVRVDNLEYSW